jgi:hypothetical protein
MRRHPRCGTVEVPKDRVGLDLHPAEAVIEIGLG